ncbi:DUF6286 domain-containing protein [Streptomyces sp. NPDC057939]|uniref:DUF6286 domain-containing protein n=1 Tax=Streptomyces sp. NPDC057939 TaxID=3346284 RepID=UPI0036E1BC8D
MTAPAAHGATAPAARGSTTIADKVVRKIAARAVLEALPSTIAGKAGGTATVHGRRAAVALRVALPYPGPLSDTARHVQQHVADRTRQLTGLDVARPRLAVVQLVGRKQALGQPAATPSAGPAQPRTPRRWWSARRLPVVVLLLVALLVCAAATVDVIRVHLTHHPASAWRMHTVEWLAGHRLADEAVTIGALAAALVGVWLLASALTPGLRRRLVLIGTGAVRTVAVDRSTVATLVRDAVGDVDGIDTVRVRAGRRRVTVRARLAFGDQDAALLRATAAVDRILAACTLRRTPRHRVTVTPQPTWQPSASGTDTTVPDQERGSI